MRPLDIFYDGPPAFAPRAAWCLDTMLAPLGRRGRLVREREAATGCALAYAAAPVPGVPTVPLSSEALELFEAARPLPRDAYRELQPSSPPCDEAGRSSATPSAVPGAFPAAPGFAVPFDLVASAFALLACWDEHTSRERDRFDRLPFSASVFGANRYLPIERPAVDACVRLLRATLAPRLAELGAAPLPPVGWVWGEKGFAMALTHDVDNLWRWTREGFVAAARRSARAARRRDLAALQTEGRELWRWATVHLPAGTDPFWSFPQLLKGERDRGLPSTFFVLAGHSERIDGDQPVTYRRKLPQALALLRDGGRTGDEVGLHGNAAERLDAGLLRADRDRLLRRGAGEIRGIRYHYLRCLYHETLPLVEAAGFAYDSSLAFAEHEGFRCGASFPFHPYSLKEERPMHLLEVPLAVMDTTLRGDRYRALDSPAAEAAARNALSHVRAAGGLSALLWHNNSFDPHSAAGFDDLYWRLLDWAAAGGCLLGTAGSLAERWKDATEAADAV